MEKEDSYIEKFTSLYGASANEIKFLTQKQKKEFGFTIFILFRENLDRAIKLGIRNSQNLIGNLQSVPFLIFVCIFLPIIMLLETNPFTGLFNDILFLFIIFSFLILGIIPIFKNIDKKVNQFMKVRVFLNIDKNQSQKIDKDFITLNFENKAISQLHKNNYYNMPIIGRIICAILCLAIFIGMFSGTSILNLTHSYYLNFFLKPFILEFIAISFIFGFFEKIIFWVAKIYYQIYFYLIDKYPKFFHKQKEDFFYDLYLVGTKTIENLKLYQNSISQSKTGIIDQNFGKSFENSINGIYKIFSLIKSNPDFFSQNPKFLLFLKNLINEILDNYLSAFENIENLLNTEKKNISALKNNGQGELVNILSKNILEKQKNDFADIKNRLENLKI